MHAAILQNSAALMATTMATLRSLNSTCENYVAASKGICYWSQPAEQHLVPIHHKWHVATLHGISMRTSITRCSRCALA